ncbi:hypothetical protein [Novosphingobium sp. TH158]|uniref:hypothetical protein n=1 Tax=Novosphingobium sp. TH158 TaxID=2067455 RepID=UPI000C7CB371|nr:hypothetical protein [Novosphingobium sp. TH158]PLK24306.1 hypothetical protein C0V78_13650 [Novosphingobium sp. TH158]
MTLGGNRAHFAFAALIAFAITAFIPQVLADGDSWWHVRAGEWMLDHGAVPMTDPFSHSFAGKPWHAHEWLAEVIMAVAYWLAGWAGVMLLVAAAMGTAIGLLYQWLRRHIPALESLVAVILALGCLSPGLLARPHLLAIPMLVAWMRALMDARAEGRAPGWPWLLLILLWANMHGTALFAVALIGPFALEALIEQRRDWQRVLRQWVPFGLGALVMLVLTPRGPEGTLFLIQLTQMESLKLIIEWLPMDFTKLTGFEVLLMAGLAVIMLRGVRIRPLRIFVILLLLHMTLQHQRHQLLFGVVATMILAEAMGGRAEAARSLPRWAMPLAGLAALAVIGVRLAIPAQVLESDTAPASSFAHVPAELRGQHVLNGYPSGGFLIGQGVRPFIDGRTDLYGDAFMARYDAIMEGKPAELDKALAEFGIAWTFLPAGSTPAHEMDRKPGWRRHHVDSLIAIHVRQSGGQ